MAASSCPSALTHLGFYVLAPRSQIEQRVFGEMQRESIRSKVTRRVEEYGGEKDGWLSDWFLPVLERMEIRALSWEEILSTITEQDAGSADFFSEFYELCVRFNGK